MINGIKQIAYDLSFFIFYQGNFSLHLKRPTYSTAKITVEPRLANYNRNVTFGATEKIKNYKSSYLFTALIFLLLFHQGKSEKRIIKRRKYMKQFFCGESCRSVFIKMRF